MNHLSLLACNLTISAGCGLFWLILVLGAWLLFGSNMLDATRAAGIACIIAMVGTYGLLRFFQTVFPNDEP